MDLSYRAKKHGFSTYFFVDVNIKHAGEGSSSRTFAVTNIYKNLLMFYKKQMGEPAYNVAYFCLFLKAVLVYTIGKLTRNLYFQNSYGEALKLFR
jgi:GT2 family glycosyltransferase